MTIQAGVAGLRRAVLAPLLALIAAAALVQAWIPQPAMADPLVWVRQFHFGDGTWTKDIVADSSGIYVVGESFRADGHGFHGFLSKYDFDGDRLWSRFHFGPYNHDPVYDVAAGPSGVYVLSESHHPSSGAFESLLRRYHRNGDLAWSLTFDQYTSPSGLAVDDTGFVYVVCG